MRTVAGRAQWPVPGISAEAGTPAWISAASMPSFSSTDREFASLLVPKMASPEQPFFSSHLQWRTNLSLSGERSALNGVTTGDSTPRRRAAAFGWTMAGEAGVAMAEFAGSERRDYARRAADALR